MSHCQHRHRSGRARRGFRGYLGARLHRRLFFWTGLAIFVTLGAAASIVHWASAYGSQSTAGNPTLQGVEAFFAAQFAEVWHSPAQRARLQKRASEAFRVELQLYDKQGRTLDSADSECDGHTWSFAVEEQSQSLGSVTVCAGSRFSTDKSPLFLGLATAGFVLWIFTGLLARKLSRPLVELTHVTREIGEGRLSSRARLGRQHSGEVGQLAHSINDMAARIERQLRGQRELLAAVSHEIRTPLSRLRVLTELLRERNVDETSLTKIELEVAEIDDLIGQLLANSRIEFEHIDVRKLDAQQVALASLDRTSLAASLLTLSGTARPIHGDATLITRALVNLIENATRHGEGLVELELRFDEGHVVFTAKDHGPGFRQEDLPRVFEPFFRSKHSEKSTSSLGLGLALVSKIAQAHGGKTYARNREGGGAEVGFELTQGQPKIK